MFARGGLLQAAGTDGSLIADKSSFLYEIGKKSPAQPKSRGLAARKAGAVRFPINLHSAAPFLDVAPPVLRPSSTSAPYQVRGRHSRSRGKSRALHICRTASGSVTFP